MPLDYRAQAEGTLAAIKRLKQNLAEAAEKNDSEGLASMVNAIASAEGRYMAQERVADCQQGGLSKEETLAAAIQLLAQSGQDTYSGRGNDARRAKADGLKAALQDLVYTL